MKYTINQIKKENDKKLLAINKINELCSKYNSLDEIDDFYDFLIVISSLSAQAKAPLVEDFIARKSGWERVPSSVGRGDFLTPQGKYIELKVSFHNKEEKLNLRQIRLYQGVDEYLCIYLDDTGKLQENSACFVLSKEQMEEEVKQLGSFTHGTKAANKGNKNVEYSISIPMNNSSHSWFSKYLVVMKWGR